jgi:hypothetical protein
MTNRTGMALLTQKFLSIAASLIISFGLIACNHSASISSSASDTDLTPQDAEARKALLAEIQKHWQHGADGWTASVTNGRDRFLRQYRDLAIDSLDPRDLSESDKLNGFEWVGKVTFKKTACREAGGQHTFVLGGMADGQQAYVEKQPGRWTQWVTFTPGPLSFQKEKGRWTFSYDATYLRGQLPAPGDFAAAGVH